MNETVTIATENTFLKDLSSNQLQQMQKAGAQIKDCYRLLKKNEDYGNVVREVLKDQGQFVEYEHYPKGDVHDPETYSQYFYHAHRGLNGENGHFHTFLRAKGMPESATPAPYEGPEKWPAGDDALSHIIAISMNPTGYPIGLFSTNRWVTGETFYTADNVINMLDSFEMDLLYPSWPVNIWITATMKLFRPQIENLLKERDKTIDKWQQQHPDLDVYEDRNLEITSQLNVDVDHQLTLVKNELASR